MRKGLPTSQVWSRISAGDRLVWVNSIVPHRVRKPLSDRLSSRLDDQPESAKWPRTPTTQTQGWCNCNTRAAAQLQSARSDVARHRRPERTHTPRGRRARDAVAHQPPKRGPNERSHPGPIAPKPNRPAERPPTEKRGQNHQPQPAVGGPSVARPGLAPGRQKASAGGATSYKKPNKARCRRALRGPTERNHPSPIGRRSGLLQKTRPNHPSPIGRRSGLRQKPGQSRLPGQYSSAL